MKKLLVALVGGVQFMGVACFSGEVERISCPLADAVAEAGGDESPVDTLPGEGTAMAGLTGGACTKNEECVGGTCLTTEFLKPFVEGVEVPGGMCSAFPCVDDAQCGPDAFCLDASAVSPDVTGIKLCLRKCKDSSDCRYNSGYGCYELPITGGDPVFACMPNALVKAINCGNGVCDLDEFSTGSCPEDCK